MCFRAVSTRRSTFELDSIIAPSLGAGVHTVKQSLMNKSPVLLELAELPSKLAEVRSRLIPGVAQQRQSCVLRRNGLVDHGLEHLIVFNAGLVVEDFLSVVGISDETCSCMANVAPSRDPRWAVPFQRRACCQLGCHLVSACRQLHQCVETLHLQQPSVLKAVA